MGHVKSSTLITTSSNTRFVEWPGGSEAVCLSVLTRVRAAVQRVDVLRHTTMSNCLHQAEITAPTVATSRVTNLPNLCLYTALPILNVIRCHQTRTELRILLKINLPDFGMKIYS